MSSYMMDQDGSQSLSPPPAPPFPQQNRYGQRAATAIARFAHPFFTGPRFSAYQENEPVKAKQAHGGHESENNK